jgi:hypothetical protein
MAREPNVVAKSSVKEAKKVTNKKAPAVPQSNADKAQEAKDLRALAAMLNAKNSPDTSKDITVFAKETIKLVSKSQKSDSAAFKREATKALVEFRNFVEKTEKVTELRRSQLLGQIDGVALDAKNATMMMLSVAKTQAKTIKDTAKREVAADKLKLKQFHDNLVAESEAKAKTLVADAKLKSKVLATEQTDKIKALSTERKAKYTQMMAEGKSKILEQKDALKVKRDNHNLTIQKEKQDLKDERVKQHQHYANMRTQMKDRLDARKKVLDQQRDDQKAKSDTDRLQLQQDRAAAAGKIKKLKGDLRDDYQTKMRNAKADIANKKAESLKKNKERIQKIREMQTEHKVRLKKIEDDARGEGLIRKAALRKELKEKDTRLAKADKHTETLKNVFKDGLMEDNPLIEASTKIFKGLKGFADKRKERNTLKHGANGASGAIVSKATPTAPQANGAAPAPANGSPGLFGGLLSMIPNVSGIISGIGSLFSGIVGAFGKVGSLVMGAARFVPIIAVVATVVGGILSFMEGFNDASSIFGEKIDDKDYTKRVYAGFVNVVGSILGIFDTVAGWLGFDTDLEGGFKKKAVALFDTILGAFKSVVGGIGELLDYIPGMGGVAKRLKSFASSDSGQVQEVPTEKAPVLSEKTNSVNNLKDEVEARKGQKASVQVVTDNSVKQTSTTIVSQKMSTRNPDRTVALYGYGGVGTL